MVSSTEIFSETLTYPGLERILHNVLSPAIAVEISQISYRPGYLPNPDNDRLLLSQIVTINSQPLIADSVEIWIKEGLQLVTFPIDSAYSLRLVLPSWYQEIAVNVSTIDGLALAPGSGSITSQAGLNAAIAQFNAALATKAAAADVATLGTALALKADVSALSDFIDTGELVQALTLKADVFHNHDDLYYPRPAVDSFINAILEDLSELQNSTGGLSLGAVTPGEYWDFRFQENLTNTGSNGLSAQLINGAALATIRGVVINDGQALTIPFPSQSFNVFTYETVLLPRSGTPGYGRILDLTANALGDGSNNNTIVIADNYEGTRRLFLELWAGSNRVGFWDFGPSLSLNRFHHLAVVSTGSQVIFWLNNRLIATINAAVPNVPRSLAILGRSSRGDQFLGEFGLSRFYLSALTETQLKNNYAHSVLDCLQQAIHISGIT